MLSSTQNGITIDHLRPNQLWRLKASYVIGFLFTLLIITFSCMWAMALVNTGQPITQTFSWCLARDVPTQVAYSAWLVLYFICRLIIFFILLEKTYIYPYAHLTTDPYEDNSNTVQHRYTGVIWFYVLVNVIAIFSLLLILIFPDQGDTQTVHFVFAGLAFVMSIVGCAVLLFTRLFRAYYTSSNYTYQDRNVLWVILMILNFLSVVAQLVMGIMFIVTPVDNAGVYEFILALLIMLDSFYILADYIRDAYDIQILFIHHEKSR